MINTKTTYANREDGTPARPSDCLVRYRVIHLPSSQTVVRTVAFEDLEAARDRIASWNQSNPTMWRYDETILTVQIYSPSPIWAPIFDTRKDKDGVFRGGHGYWRSGRIQQALDPSQ